MTDHRLSEAVRAQLGGGPELDWCGFAKWSSYTVGLQFGTDGVGLTKLTLADVVARHVPGWLLSRDRIVALLHEQVEVPGDLVVNALRLGNASIFWEMGSVFTRLLGRLPDQAARAGGSGDAEFAAEVVAQAIAPGPKAVPEGLSLDLLTRPPITDPLERAIGFYLRAAREPERRAELVLAGNALFSVFEQTRADRLIAIGICAPVRARLIPVLRAVSLLPDDPRGAMLAGAGQSPPPLSWVEGGVVRELTDLALRVDLGGTQVELGHPERLPPPAVTPTDPEAAAALAEVTARADGRVPDWVDLDYRLGFIARYFAAYARLPEALTEPPL